VSTNTGPTSEARIKKNSMEKIHEIGFLGQTLLLNFQSDLQWSKSSEVHAQHLPNTYQNDI